MIRFACPECSKSLSFGSDSAGEAVRCPRCAAFLRVPDARPPRRMSAPPPGRRQLGPVPLFVGLSAFVALVAWAVHSGGRRVADPAASPAPEVATPRPADPQPEREDAPTPAPEHAPPRRAAAREAFAPAAPFLPGEPAATNPYPPWDARHYHPPRQAEETPGALPPVRGMPAGAKSVHVGGYTRKDGTRVKAHDRAAPRRR